MSLVSKCGIFVEFGPFLAGLVLDLWDPVAFVLIAQSVVNLGEFRWFFGMLSTLGWFNFGNFLWGI